MTTDQAPSTLHSLHHTAADILGRWGLDGEQQQVLLGAPGRRRRSRRARVPELPESERVERLQLIIAIDRMLSQTFPQASLLADLWVTTPHAMLGNRTPLTVMLEQGTAGMTSIRELLDGRGGWAGI